MISDRKLDMIIVLCFYSSWVQVRVPPPLNSHWTAKHSNHWQMKWMTSIYSDSTMFLWSTLSPGLHVDPLWPIKSTHTLFQTTWTPSWQEHIIGSRAFLRLGGCLKLFVTASSCSCAVAAVWQHTLSCSGGSKIIKVCWCHTEQVWSVFESLIAPTWFQDFPKEYCTLVIWSVLLISAVSGFCVMACVSACVIHHTYLDTHVHDAKPDVCRKCRAYFDFVHLFSDSDLTPAIFYRWSLPSEAEVRSERQQTRLHQCQLHCKKLSGHPKLQKKKW